MVFTLAMLVELVLSMGLALEVYFRGVGDRISIMNHTRDDFKFRDGASFVLYAVAAFIVSAVQCVQARQSFDQQKDRSIWDLYDLPMTLNASAYLVRFILSSVRILCTDKREFRDSFVPTNIGITKLGFVFISIWLNFPRCNALDQACVLVFAQGTQPSYDALDDR